MTTRRVLVAGGAGFLGSHLCERLLRDDHHVIAADDFSTGHARNVQHLLQQRRFELRRHDVTQPLAVDVDGIFNLACPGSPEHYQSNPVRTATTNALGTLNLLELASQRNARIFHASSCEVYGNSHVSPQIENDHGSVNCLGPRSALEEGKRFAETLCFAYFRQRGVAVRIGRLFNTYGPGLQPGDGRAISNFITQALRGEDLVVYGTGEQTRSFCYVDDMVEGIVRLMDGDAEGPLNLGHPQEVTVLELAETVLRLTRSRSRVVHGPLPADEPKRLCPDLQHTTSHLGWQPRVPLEEGLQETIRHFRHMLH
jgi:UDP-glucuronate decarboxylase